KSLGLNALRISRIRDMVNLNGKRSSVHIAINSRSRLAHATLRPGPIAAIWHSPVQSSRSRADLLGKLALFGVCAWASGGMAGCARVVIAAVAAARRRN